MAESIEHIDPKLEIEEHIDAHQRGFKIQRIGIVAILLFVLLAALGLFGDGLLSKRTESTESTRVEYQRFYRFEARMELRINLLQFENANVVSFPKDYLKEFQLESITPTTESTNFKGDRSEFVFNGPGNGVITFYLIPKSVGSIKGDVLVNGEKFELQHFIYP